MDGREVIERMPRPVSVFYLFRIMLSLSNNFRRTALPPCESFETRHPPNFATFSAFFSDNPALPRREDAGTEKMSEPKRHRGRNDIETEKTPKKAKRAAPPAHPSGARLPFQARTSTISHVADPRKRERVLAHGGFVETPAHTCTQARTSGIMYRLYTKLFLVSSCALPLRGAAVEEQAPGKTAV